MNNKVVTFTSNQAGYEKWWRENRDVFIVSTCENPESFDGEFVKLHRHCCWTIDPTRTNPKNKTLTNPYPKVCSDSKEALLAHFRRMIGDPNGIFYECKLCSTKGK